MTFFSELGNADDEQDGNVSSRRPAWGKKGRDAFQIFSKFDFYIFTATIGSSFFNTKSETRKATPIKYYRHRISFQETLIESQKSFL